MSRAHRGRVRILAGILAFTVISTALHYTHNFVEIDQYPRSGLVSNSAVLVGVLLSWPLLTAIGLAGYRLYRRSPSRRAHAYLLTYSFVGWLTLGHFTAGNPDIPAFWYATIFTDALGAALITGFVAVSARSPEPARASSMPAHGRRAEARSRR